MAYTPPTPDDLKARFPKFAAVGDPELQGALDEAARMVDETWTEGDFALARMLLAAHILTVDGVGAGTEAELNAAGVQDFQKIKLGTLALERFDREKASASATDTYLTTSYGKRFVELMRRNVGGPIVARGVPAGLSHLARDWPVGG